MNWDLTIGRIKQVVDIAIKADVHAAGLVITGGLLVIHGAKDTGQAMIAAGLAVFKGGNGS